MKLFKWLGIERTKKELIKDTIWSLIVGGSFLTLFTYYLLFIY